MLVDVMCRGGKRSTAFIGHTFLLTWTTKHLCKSSRYHISVQVFEKVKPDDYLNQCPSPAFIYRCVWMANRF